MNDLDLIRELTPEARLPGHGELAPARGRLTAAIAAERASGGAPGPSSSGEERSRPAGTRARRSPASWRARRPALVALAAAVTAAAVATALVAMPGGHNERPSARGAPGPSATAPPQSGTVNVTAARFLRNAAAATVRRQASPPGPGQFVYTETEGVGGADKDQQWLSAYGSRDGLIQNAGQSSSVLTPCTVAQAQVPRKSPPGMLFPKTTHCTEEAGYIPAMPTDPHKLLAYLIKIQVAEPADAMGTSWAANDLGKAVDYLMSTTYLLPAQQAALFELMAQTPGFTVVRGARDAVGRIGVAIKWTYEGAPAEIILDPSTYAYLGDRTWPAPGFHGPGANAYDGGALVKIAFVNKAGQLP
jgi:hypothetical protein